VDPSTGLPAAEYWRTATVAAESCLQANAASTAAVIRGRGAAGWLTDLGLPARLVRHDGVVLTTAGWPGSRVPQEVSR
ncbi:MAG: FAD:protein FMN transferase, partial [Actinomycetes bacterium]